MMIINLAIINPHYSIHQFILQNHLLQNVYRSTYAKLFRIFLNSGDQCILFDFRSSIFEVICYILFYMRSSNISNGTILVALVIPLQLFLLLLIRCCLLIAILADNCHVQKYLLMHCLSYSERHRYFI